MDLAAAFYISVYSLAALAGAILAWAENVPSVTMLTVPIAIAMLFLNERQRVFRIDGGWVALAGVAAFAFPAIEFFRGDEEFRLLSGAHLLVILQWVLLAYHKTAHQYWWICALSCLQVAVAAVLTYSPFFGIFILIYMFWALWTLSLFTLLLARLRFGRDDDSLSVRRSAWQWPELNRTTAPETLVPDSKRRTAVGDQTSPGQRRIRKRASEFRGTFQCEPHETDLNMRFVLGVTGISTLALILGLILFLLTPRVWIGAVNPLQDEMVAGHGRQVTGFSETVQLNDFGKILESSAPVMELKLFDDATGAQLSLEEAVHQVGLDEVLLRGAALAIYERGQWMPFEPRSGQDVPTGPSPFNTRTVPLIRQEIRLEPIGSNTLFTLGHPLYVKLDRADSRARRQMQTGSISIASRNGLIPPGTNYQAWSPKQGAKTFGIRRSLAFRSEAYLSYPDSLEILVKQTRSVLQPFKQAAGAIPPTPIQIARELVKYLRDSGQFQYSLDRSVVDANLDPIEDFLVNRKKGHCQYFAAALALMLRVEGIPTCVITGFKGGIENSNRKLIEIQQRHAHAWVEAYIDGNWVTLDATPADGREEAVEAVGDRMRFWHQLASLGTTLWNDYVLNLSFSKQQQDLYGPVQQLFQSITGQTKDSSGFWRGLAETITQFWLHPERWFSWQGGIVAFILMGMAVGGGLAFRALSRLIRRTLSHQSQAKRESLRIEFHVRFLALLKPLGLVPRPNQTQLEFASQVSEVWSVLQLPAEHQPLADDVARAFDRLRFGNQALDAAEETRLLAALEKLEGHLRKPSKA